MPAAMSKWYFDRQIVIDALGKDEAARMYRASMFVKQVAQRSMRPGGKKGKSARPGEAPRYHRKILRNGAYGVQGWYDPKSRSSVTGAAPFPKAKTPNGSHVLEFGGVTQLTRKNRQFRTRNIGGVKRVIASTVEVTNIVRYHAFPYMNPAMHVAIREGKIPELWAGTLRGK